MGDWDGDGFDEPGFHNGDMWFLKSSWTGPWIHGWIPLRFGSANETVQPVVGDWDGNGVDSIGTYEDGLFVLAPDYDNLATDTRVIDFGAVDATAINSGAVAHPVIGAFDGVVDRVGIVLHDSVQYAPDNSSSAYDFISYSDPGLVQGVVPTLDLDIRPVVANGSHIGIPNDSRNRLGFVIAPNSPQQATTNFGEFNVYSINGVQNPSGSGSVIIPANEPWD